jgi:hypothetical protein
MTSPSMPCGNDSSSIIAFTTMMLPIDQIILCIGFHLTDVYGCIACAQGRRLTSMAALRVLRVEVLYKCIVMLLNILI